MVLVRQHGTEATEGHGLVLGLRQGLVDELDAGQLIVVHFDVQGRTVIGMDPVETTPVQQLEHATEGFDCTDIGLELDRRTLDPGQVRLCGGIYPGDVLVREPPLEWRLYQWRVIPMYTKTRSEG